MDRLVRATTEVGRLFGTEPNCVPAVALLVSAAELLGYNLTPRAVALAAQCGDQTVLLGAASAVDFPGAEVGAAFDDSGWNGAGHLVATLQRPGYLLDPTLQQISARLGVPPFALAAPLDSALLEEGPWSFSEERLKLRYHLVPHDQTWRGAYEAARHECAPAARDLAAIVRSGSQGVLVWD